MFAVGSVLKQFGPTSGGGGGGGPDVPTLDVNVVDGIATATVSDSSIGSNNGIYILGLADSDFVLDGSRTGDGDVALSVTNPGRYLAYIYSTLNSQSVISNIVVFWLESGDLDSDIYHSPADIVRWLLISQGKGSEPDLDDDWPIFTSSEPETPDNCITTYDTSGILEGRIQYSGSMAEHFGFQIRVRGTDHNTAWQKINELKENIDKNVQLETVNIQSSIYLVEAITRSGGILALGKESPTSQRLVFTLNAIVALRQLS